MVSLKLRDLVFIEPGELKILLIAVYRFLVVPHETLDVAKLVVSDHLVLPLHLFLALVFESREDCPCHAQVLKIHRDLSEGF